MIVLYNYSGFCGDYLFYTIWELADSDVDLEEEDNYACINYCNELCVVRV